MRGEKKLDLRSTAPVGGSPPRARGEVYKYETGIVTNRITPACAGRSLFQDTTPLYV